MSSFRQQGYKPQPAQARRNGGGYGTRSAPRKRKKQKRRGRPFRMFLLLVLFALLATVGVMGYMMYDEVGKVERENTFYQGVYIDGVELNGMTPDVAAQYLYDRALTELATFSVRLIYGGQEWLITAETLGITQALDMRVRDEINKAFMIGRDDASLIERYQVISELKDDPYLGYTSGVEGNVQPIDAIVAEIQHAAYIPPQDASQQFDTTRNYAHVINDEVYGQEVDGLALKNQIIGLINNMESGVINVATKPISPTVTRAMLEGEMTLIASFSTQINKNSTVERTANVELGCSKFDGMRVKSGQVVSFNNITGKRTVKNGYHEALEIVSGEFEMGVGGGICQVSSTLYNVVIEAGLEVVERTNHGIPVNYIGMGLDATVSDDRHDFRFKNNTDSDIMIAARVVTDGSGKKECLFQIYGKPNPNGYSYSLRAEVIEEIPIPAPTKIPDKKQQYVHYLDETYQATDGSVGHKVQTFLVTKDSSGSVVSEKKISEDTYKPSAPKIYVGVERRK